MDIPFPRLAAFSLMAALPLSPAAQAFECAASSPEHTVPLLELYTSEGCSSCPPADRWLSGLKNADLAGQLVPLALHVDYWDYIGWKDRFAHAGFASRQRELATQAGRAPVYTPQFFVQGRPFGPSASSAAFERELAAIRRRPAAADITLRLDPVTEGKLSFRVSARLRAPNAAKPAELFVALFQNGLTSVVNAGENRGATLHHDFVVREWHGPLPVSAEGGAESTMRFALPPDRGADSFGIAAFIQDQRTREVLQAVSRQVCG